MVELKWKRCRKSDDWLCDECRHCTEPVCKNCGPERRRKWMKHLGEDIALCDQCWSEHHLKYEQGGSREAADGRAMKGENNSLPGSDELVRLGEGRLTYSGVDQSSRMWFDVTPEMVGLVVESGTGRPWAGEDLDDIQSRAAATVLFEGRYITVDIRAFQRIGRLEHR